MKTVLGVREATQADQSFVYDLTKENLPDMVGSPVLEWSWADFEHSWRRGTNLILTVNGQTACYLRWELDADALHLADLQIVREFRRQGFAIQAMSYVEREAAARGFHRVSLIVHDANARARTLYDKLGYRCETRDDTRSLMIKGVGGMHAIRGSIS